MIRPLLLSCVAPKRAVPIAKLSDNFEFRTMKKNKEGSAPVLIVTILAGKLDRSTRWWSDGSVVRGGGG